MDDIRMTFVLGKVNRPSTGRVLRFRGMKKDTRLTFRVRSDLKRQLEAIAVRESQSVTRICEAFLLAGTDLYKKEGTKFLQRLFGRIGTRSLD
jgi:hypothetical protein